MGDGISNNISAMFLLLSSCLLIPFLLQTIRSSSPVPARISVAAFMCISIPIVMLSALFALFLGVGNIVLACALALGIGLSVLHPVAATSFFVAILLTRPWEAIPQNHLLMALPRLMAVLTVLTWLVYAIRLRKTHVVWNFPCWCYATFVIWLFFCCLFSRSMTTSLSFFSDTFLPITVIAFLITNVISKREDVELFSRTLVISVLGVISVAVYTTIQDYSIDPSFFRLHARGMWGNANDLAALMVIILPIALAPLLQRKKGASATLVSLALGIFILVSLLWSQSRGAQIAVLVGTIIYLISCTKKKKALLFTSVATIFLLIVLFVMPQRDEMDLAGSTSSRANYLIAGLRMAKDSPIFGVGPNNYSLLYEQYTPAFLEWGKRTAHSSWVLILAEAGVVGFLLFLGLFLTTLRAAWRIRSSSPQYLLMIINYGIVMSFLSHTYLFLPYVLFAFVLAAARIPALKESPSFETRSSRFPKPSLVRNFSRPVTAIFLVLFCVTYVRAQDLQVFEASAGANKPTGNHSPSTSEHVILKGSRAETLLFMLKMSGNGCFPFAVKMPQAVQPDLNVTLYSLPPVKTQHPSFPGAFIGAHLDPAVPLSSNSLCLDPKLKENWFLGELKIGPHTKPSSYDFSISSGKKNISFALSVWAMTMPEQPALPAYSEFTPWFALLGHYGKWHDSEGELAQQYIAAMIEHRIYPLKSIVAPLKITGESTLPLLEISDKPSPQTSFNSIVVNSRPAWAYFDFPTVGSSGFEPIDFSKAQTYFRAAENTIPLIKRPGKSLVYLWDEPQKTAYPELVRLSKLVKKYAPSLKQMVTITYLPELASSVDIFAPVIDQFDNADFPSPDVYRKLQKEGHEVWWYVSCMSHGCEALADTGVPDMVLDRPASYVRSIGWLSMRYHIDAFLYYSSNYGYQFYPKRDPWQSLWDFSGNGDGTLFYPGRPGEHGLIKQAPIASLRLKLWRESSFDAQYIKWIMDVKNKPSWWEPEFRALVHSTTDWSRDYTKYQQLREKVGEFMSKLSAGH